MQAEFVLVVSEHLDESFHDQLGYLRLEAGNSDHLDELVEVLRIHLTRLDHIRLLNVVEVVNQERVNQTSQKSCVSLGKLIFSFLGYELHHLYEVVSVELDHLLHDLGHLLLGLEYLEFIIFLLIRLLHSLQLIRWRHDISSKHADSLDELTEDGRFATLLLQALQQVSLRFIEKFIRDSQRMMHIFQI